MCLSPPGVELEDFSISVHFKISKVQIFGAYRFHSWGRLTYALLDFFVRNSFLNNFYLNNFLM